VAIFSAHLLLPINFQIIPKIKYHLKIRFSGENFGGKFRWAKKTAHPTLLFLMVENWSVVMSNYRRLYVNGGTYFFTVVTYQRQPFLINPPCR